MNDIRLDTIEEAVEDLRNGKLIIVVDDEDRENEGDFIAAAEKITPEMVNFMATEGRGLICVAITEERCEELELDMMVGRNTSSRAAQKPIAPSPAASRDPNCKPRCLRSSRSSANHSGILLTHGSHRR